VFDSERWQELYGDPGFPKHVSYTLLLLVPAAECVFQQVAVAQHLGLQILRMSDALVLPLNTTHYSYELENYLDRYVGLL
jgi:N-acetylated-alpha-linked acidic dipeptidase